MSSEKTDDPEEKLSEQDVADLVAELRDLARTDPDAFVHMVKANAHLLSREQIEEIQQAVEAALAKSNKPA